MTYTKFCFDTWFIFHVLIYNLLNLKDRFILPLNFLPKQSYLTAVLIGIRVRLCEVANLGVLKMKDKYFHFNSDNAENQIRHSLTSVALSRIQTARIIMLSCTFRRYNERMIKVQGAVISQPKPTACTIF